MIIMEIPLPMPLSVIFSPSHMQNSVPAVMMSIVEMVKNVPGFMIASALIVARKPTDCAITIGMVSTRVYWLIFFRPDSPSFWSFWKYGTAIVSSCNTMEAEM
uniref:Uncharacterized protein n=1 Tax=Tanacetum cinerariifolium TaxID=118510 RepID=A0A699WVY9_TANCI|nr:hypothetical protein [Tanacetum cinerariifolium]